jgi:hypothetical protein
LEFQQKYNRNININNKPHNHNINGNFIDEEIFKTSKEKFNTINANNLNNSKSFTNINAGSNTNSGINNNANTDYNYNVLKTESETSGRSSPKTKSNKKNNLFEGKIHKTEGNRIGTDSDYFSHNIIKNKIPLNNKIPKNDPYKV